MVVKEELWAKFLANDCMGLLQSAADYLKKVEAFDVMHISGLALAKVGQAGKATDFLAASLSLATPREDWFANAAIVFRETGQNAESLLFAENGLKLFPDSIQLRYLRGLALVFLHRRDEAKEAFQGILALNPKFYHAKVSYAFTLQLEGRFDEAVEIYKTIEGVPEADQDDINNNIAWSLMDTGRQREALEWLRTKCLPTPRNLFNQSMIMIGLGMWPEGWDLYKHRRDPQAANQSDASWRNVREPFATKVEDLKGKRVLFFPEQGFGDTLQFIRYAKLIMEHAAHTTIAVPTPLFRLAKCLCFDKPCDVIDRIEQGKDDFYDVALSMLDAPSVFRTTVDTIPASVPYLCAPDGINLPWRGKLHVGLCWRGASRPEDIRSHAIDERRSIPFEVVQPLLDLSEIFDFVSLQHPAGEEEDRKVDDPRLMQPLTLENDFLDTARIINQLDLVITIDSAIAHLAGALGKPVWLLNRFDNCWRWFWDGRTTSPWYPTMRIFHQAKSYEWAPVIDEVKAALLQYLTEFTK